MSDALSFCWMKLIVFANHLLIRTHFHFIVLYSAFVWCWQPWNWRAVCLRSTVASGSSWPRWDRPLKMILCWVSTFTEYVQTGLLEHEAHLHITCIAACNKNVNIINGAMDFFSPCMQILASGLSLFLSAFNTVLSPVTLCWWVPNKILSLGYLVTYSMKWNNERNVILFLFLSLASSWTMPERPCLCIQTDLNKFVEEYVQCLWRFSKGFSTPTLYWSFINWPKPIASMRLFSSCNTQHSFFTLFILIHFLLIFSLSYIWKLISATR